LLNKVLLAEGEPMVGFFRYIFSINKLNADRHQQALAQLFIDYAERRKPWEDIFAFLEERRWLRDEREHRIVHALSMVRVARVDLYQTAKELGELIIAGARSPTGPSRITDGIEVEKISAEMTEEIGMAVVALMEVKGVRTIHGMIGILLTTVIVLMKRLPPSNTKEEIRKSMLSALAQC
jgi:hypothetical protein